MIAGLSAKLIVKTVLFHNKMFFASVKLPINLGNQKSSSQIWFYELSNKSLPFLSAIYQEEGKSVWNSLILQCISNKFYR